MGRGLEASAHPAKERQSTFREERSSAPLPVALGRRIALLKGAEPDGHVSERERMQCNEALLDRCTAVVLATRRHGIFCVPGFPVGWKALAASRGFCRCVASFLALLGLVCSIIP